MAAASRALAAEAGFEVIREVGGGGAWIGDDADIGRFELADLVRGRVDVDELRLRQESVALEVEVATEAGTEGDDRVGVPERGAAGRHGRVDGAEVLRVAGGEA